MRFAFILDHAGEYHITTMCRVLTVSKAGYYAWVNRPPSARVAADATLAAEIRVIHATSRGTYGSPRVQEELKAQGKPHGVNRVARIMQGEGIRGKTKRRFVVTTDSTHAHPTAPNTLNRKFDVDDAGGQDRVWIGDITYLATREGWLYLAIVMDLASRRIIGWAMRHTLEGELTREALTMALTSRQPGLGVLHHADRGSQPEFNRSSQQSWRGVIVAVRSALRQACSSRVSSAVWC